MTAVFGGRNGRLSNYNRLVSGAFVVSICWIRDSACLELMVFDRSRLGKAARSKAGDEMPSKWRNQFVKQYLCYKLP